LTYKTPVPQALTRKNAEPDLDLIEPGSVGRRVVKDKAIAVPLIPLLNPIAFMSVEIVENQMNRTFGVVRGQLVKERKEINGFTSFVHPTQKFPRMNFECAKQAECTVANVLVFYLSGPTRPWHYDGLLSFERLNTRFLVDAHNDSTIPWSIDVQVNDVVHLFLEEWVLAVEPHPKPVRLQVDFVDDLPNCCRAHLTNSAAKNRSIIEGLD
jgi:hypothetical protein